MLLVNNNNLQEPLLESNYEKYEELNGTALQISFTSFSFLGNPGHELIDFNVNIEDEDGHVYKVKQLTSTGKSKSVIATHIYFELIGNRKYDDFVGNRSFNEFASWLFNNSGWTFENVDITESLNFNNFGNDNFIQLLQRLITRFDCEMQILPNKVIRFARRITRNEDKQYRYKNNIKTISRSVDTTNVRTRILAYGENDLQVSYISPLSSNPLFGLIDAEPVSDTSINNTNELFQLAMASLNDTPDTNIEVSVLDIDGQVGDNVWLIHEEMDLEYQVRILSKRTRRDYNESEVEIGNKVRRTIEDAIIEQKIEVKENKEEAKQDIEDLDEKTTAQTAEVRLFVENVEQTLNSSITLTASQIRSEVNDTENRLNSTITQTANNIQLQVNNADQRISTLDIRANQIQSTVINLENNTNSSITQLSNSINLKVDVGGTINDINVNDNGVQINADRINLNGAVIVNGSISGATDINVNRNISIGNALYFGGYQGSVDFIEISGGDMTFNSFGNFNFSGGDLFINGRRVMTEQGGI